jgi:hypothetical protein
MIALLYEVHFFWNTPDLLRRVDVLLYDNGVGTFETLKAPAND